MPKVTILCRRCGIWHAPGRPLERRSRTVVYVVIELR